MTTKDLIDDTAAEVLWKSPEDKTPERTLYSAISCAISKKGRASRFKKAGKGRFALQGEA